MLNALIIDLHDRLDETFSDDERYRIIKHLCELLGCDIPKSILEEHEYWLKDIKND